MTLIGDSINISSDSPFPILNPTGVIVGENAEISVESSTGSIVVDVNDDSFDITITSFFTQNDTVASSIQFTFSDLNWVGVPNGFITGVIPTSADAAGIVPSFTDDSITVTTTALELNFEDPEVTFSFDIITDTPDVPLTLIGTDDPDTLIGGGADDFINGLAFSDLLSGSGGNDTILGGNGRDTLDGGSGDDSLDGGGSFDQLLGGEGNDILLGGNGRDTLDGGSDNDFLDGGASDDQLLGGDGNDTLLGGAGRDTLSGDGGNDSLDGGASDDDLLGGDGDDTLIGGVGRDTLNGGVGNDLLTGGSSPDTFILTAGEGMDTITDFTNSDSIGLSGGITFGDLSFAGNDIIFGAETLATLTGIDPTSLSESDFVII